MRLIACLCLSLFFGLAQAETNETVFSKKPKEAWVLESENAFVIEDKYPQAPVHLLVVSKEIIPTINDVPQVLMGEMLQLAKTAAKQYGIDQTGYRLVVNTNMEGGQGVYHVHIHVLGGRQMQWPPG